MDVDLHLRVLWRFRWIMLAGIVLGAAFAVLATYQVRWEGRPTFERRGVETWTSTSSILVTQPGFPWGRVTLPGLPLTPGGTPVPAPEDRRSGDLQFADPGRFSSLALLYSVISYSDRVREQLPEPPAPGQIEATAADATGQGNQFLPIIRLTTRATTAAGARRLNVQTLGALTSLIRAEQDRNDIPPSQRVQLSMLDRPSAGWLEQGRPFVGAILSFLLCLVAATALAHIFEARWPSGGVRAAPGEPAPGGESAGPRVLEPVAPLSR